MQRLCVTDMHTAGEPVRIVTDGYPDLPGATILEKRREAMHRHDALRRMLVLEPRGHAGMYGVIPVAPTDPRAAFAALFIHGEGYSTMCGHATIALGRWLVESGRVPVAEPETRFCIELPCGLVEIRCAVENGIVHRTAFISVPAFLSRRDVAIAVPGLGPVRFDLAYGGAFYAVLPASRLGLSFCDAPFERLVSAATALTDAARSALDIVHPDAEDLGFLYGTILTDDAAPPAPTYNLCVFADGQIDRSPTGSGVTARMARDHALGLIRPGQERLFFGPTGIGFSGCVTRADEPIDGTVRVLVSGRSHHSGTAVFDIEPDDQLGGGFTLPKTFRDVAGRDGCA
ncbi:proline racemase family protein [Sphingosinicella sp. LHD-64]|uniref:proline racemase family protein n=1 Tax=Sphingosinicella sp. LHD-64 TaxID=3072139 RepID=UPI00280DC200|nr:proline racemase family protein [Sphingosinicella sp. LHD-64]MDQ8755494.1 proline racemase family protein [Sphingosinicella sp. LHD-64]